MSVDFVKFLSRGNHLVRQMATVSMATEKLTRVTAEPVKTNVMQAWQIHRYGNINELKLAEVNNPTIKKPSEVLVKVLATSVNPIDVAMLGGYGNVLLDTMRKVDPICNKDVSLPLTLGRDFAGEVVSKGANVRPDIMVGDIIYGVIPPHCQGCHSQLAITDQSLVCRKPDDFGTIEASSILYTGLTAWSSLKITGDLILASPKNKRVLIIGGCGGVGHIAVQLLKVWGLEVATTCRTDCIEMLTSLGVDHVVDYTHRDHMNHLNNIGKFDIILDASGNVSPVTYVPMLKDWSNSKFISLRSPLLQNTDSYGLLAGMARNAADLVVSNMSSGAAAKGSSIRWGFFMPVPAGIKEIAQMVEEKKIRPIVEKIYKFSEVPQAFERMNQGHLRGKVVIDLTSAPTTELKN